MNMRGQLNENEIPCFILMKMKRGVHACSYSRRYNVGGMVAKNGREVERALQKIGQPRHFTSVVYILVDEHMKCLKSRAIRDNEYKVS